MQALLTARLKYIQQKNNLTILNVGTGKDISIDIVWLAREHDYSSTKLKTQIHNIIKEAGDYYD